MTIAATIPEAIKAKYRKVKVAPGAIKAAVYNGCKATGAAVQFQSDVRVYNLWEALLFVEGYEADGYFSPGTAEAASKLLKGD